MFFIFSIINVLLILLLCIFPAIVISKKFQFNYVYLFSLNCFIYILTNFSISLIFLIIINILSGLIMLIFKVKIIDSEELTFIKLIKKLYLFIFLFILLYMYDVYIIKTISTSGVQNLLFFNEDISFAQTFFIKHYLIAFNSLLISFMLLEKYISNRYEFKIIYAISLFFGVMAFTINPMFNTVNLRSSDLFLIIICFNLIPLIWLTKFDSWYESIILIIICFIVGPVALIFLTMWILVLLILKFLDLKLVVIISAIFFVIMFILGNGIQFLIDFLTYNQFDFYQVKTLCIDNQPCITRFILLEPLFITLFIYSIYEIIKQRKKALYPFLLLIVLFANPFFWTFSSQFIEMNGIRWLILLISIGGHTIINAFGFINFFDKTFKNIFGQYSYIVILVGLFLLIF